MTALSSGRQDRRTRPPLGPQARAVPAALPRVDDNPRVTAGRLPPGTTVSQADPAPTARLSGARNPLGIRDDEGNGVRSLFLLFRHRIHQPAKWPIS